jgi:hypothetical protein
MKIFFASLMMIAAFSCSDPPNTQYEPIGTRCAADHECGTPAYACLKTEPNGYCSRTCKVDTDCPEDAICITTTFQCMRKCSTDATCRTAEGYSCVAEGGISNVCDIAK